jgi:NitT/TauT family transport system substrate-binding protein
MKKIQKVGLLLLTIMLVLTGCGSQTANTGASVAPAKKEKVVMAISGLGAMVYLPVALGQQLGYFADEGIDLEVQDFKGGSQSGEAIIGGTVDFASMAVDQVVKAQVQGAQLRMIADYTKDPCITLIVDSKLKDKVKSVMDLKGMTIGVTSMGSGTQMAMMALLAKNGLKPDDVKFAAVGSNTMPPALENGSIQAAMNADPYVTQLVASGKAFILDGTDFTKDKDTIDLYGSDYPFTGLATRLDAIQKKPELVQKMTNAIVKTNQWIATHSAEEIAAKMPKEFKTDEQLYINSVKHSKEAYSVDGMITVAGVNTVVKGLKSGGGVPADKNVDINSVFDMTYVNKALKK